MKTVLSFALLFFSAIQLFGQKPDSTKTTGETVPTQAPVSETVAVDPATVDNFSGLPSTVTSKSDYKKNETVSDEIINLGDTHLLNKRNRAYWRMKPVRFGIINVNPYVYDVKINGYKVNYEYTTSIDSLIKTNLSTFPSISAIQRVQGLDATTGIDCESKNADIVKFQREYTSLDSSYKVFIQGFENHLTAYQQLKSLTATYEEIRLACEMSKTKADLITSIKSSINKFMPLIDTDSYKNAIDELKSNYLNALQNFKPKALEFSSTVLSLSVTALSINSTATSISTNTTITKSPEEKSCLNAGSSNLIHIIENLKPRKSIIDTMNKVIFASAALEENIIKLHGLLSDINQTTFSFVTAPVLFDSDEIDVEYVIIPKASLKYRITNLKNDQINVTYWRRWAPKAYVSVGIGFDSHNGRDYVTVGAQGYDTTRFFNGAGIQDSMSITQYDGYKIIEQKQNFTKMNIGLTLLTHLTWRVGYDARLGFNIGTQIDLNGKLKYLAGGTFTLGHDRLLNINFGAAFGTTRDLKSGYNLSKVYKNDFDKSKAPTTISFDYIHPSLSASISYNLTFNRKKTAIPKPSGSAATAAAPTPATTTTTTTTTTK